MSDEVIEFRDLHEGEFLYDGPLFIDIEGVTAMIYQSREEGDVFVKAPRVAEEIARRSNMAGRAAKVLEIKRALKSYK